MCKEGLLERIEGAMELRERLLRMTFEEFQTEVAQEVLRRHEPVSDVTVLVDEMLASLRAGADIHNVGLSVSKCWKVGEELPLPCIAECLMENDGLVRVGCNASETVMVFAPSYWTYNFGDDGCVVATDDAIDRMARRYAPYLSERSVRTLRKALAGRVRHISARAVLGARIFEQTVYGEPILRLERGVDA